MSSSSRWNKRPRQGDYAGAWRGKQPDDGAARHYPPGAPDAGLHYSESAEVSLIGSILIGGEDVMREVAWLDPQALYGGARERIWTAMRNLYERREPIDITTVCDELERLGWLDEKSDIPLSIADVGSHANMVPHSHHALAYANTIERLWRLRLVENLGMKLLQMTRDPKYNGDLGALRAQGILALRAATTTHDEVADRSLASVLSATMDDLTERMNEGADTRALRTGFPELDDWMSGLERGELVLLAGRTRNGKSAVGQAFFEMMARQIAPRGEAAAYITLEMSGEQQARRMLSRHARISGKTMRLGFRDKDGKDLDAEYEATLEWGDRLTRDLGETIRVFDRGLSLDELEDYVAENVETRHLRLIMVDQIDLFDEEGLENETVALASKRLMQITQRYRITTLALCQLNRGAEGSKWMPSLSNLRMSGRLEQDANRVWFIVRPALYEPRPDDPHWEETLVFDVAKSRDDQLGRRCLRWEGEFTAVSSWPPTWPAPNLDSEAIGYAPSRQDSTPSDDSDGIPLQPRGRTRSF